MALNDIYNWFRDKSAYFKSNSATWKVDTVTVDHAVMMRFSMFRTPSATTSPCTNTSRGCRLRRGGSGSWTARCVPVHIISVHSDNTEYDGDGYQEFYKRKLKRRRRGSEESRQSSASCSRGSSPRPGVR